MTRPIRGGVTLIEVVVGLAMLGTLLSAMLVASSSMQRLRSAAADKSAAVSLLDAQVGRLYREGFPDGDLEIPVSGPQRGWTLRFSRTPWLAAPDRFDVARLTVLRGERQTAKLASVELLLRR